MKIRSTRFMLNLDGGSYGHGAKGDWLNVRPPPTMLPKNRSNLSILSTNTQEHLQNSNGREKDNVAAAVSLATHEPNQN